jgi:hypothetical protein
VSLASVSSCADGTHEKASDDSSDSEEIRDAQETCAETSTVVSPSCADAACESAAIHLCMYVYI